MALPIAAIERCLELLAGEVRADPSLSAEFESSVETFFRGPSPAAGSIAETLAAARRHLEWFLVEHHSPSLRGSVSERLGERYSSRTEAIRREEEDGPKEADHLEKALDSLRRSHTGIFEVEGIREGAGAWLRDVTGFGSYALGTIGLATRLESGDLVVGRLYPSGDGAHVASPAAAVVRGGNVAEALERDLGSLHGGGSAKVLRVSQGELEAMFFGAGGALFGSEGSRGPEHGDLDAPAANPEGDAASADPMGDAFRALIAAGLDESHANAAIDTLRRNPRDPEHLVHGKNDALSEILDELAFDTDVDLDAARRALLNVWQLLTDAAAADAAPATPAAKAPPVDDEEARARAVDAFSAGRARGEAPEKLLGTLAEDLGINAEEDEPDAPAPDFPGVVGAMVDEMIWEFGATRDDFDVASLAPLRHLAEFAKPIGVFEEFSGSDLFQFATFWLQETRALRDGPEAQLLIEALREFCEWALDAHEVDVGSEFMDALNGLESSLPRMIAANALLEGPAFGGEDPGQRYEVLSVDDQQPEGFESSNDRVKSAAGDQLTVVLPEALRTLVEPGDHVRGDIALDGTLTVHRCYPPEAASLTGG